MKKLNKFLLTLGSISSLAALPLIAASCDKTDKSKDDNSNKKPTDTNPKTPSDPSNPSNQPQADNPSAAPATPKKVDEKKLDEWKKETTNLIKDLEEKSKEVKKPQFDEDKLKKFREENKGNKDLLDYVTELKKETFQQLVREFTEELSTLKDEFEGLLKDLPKDLLEEEFESLTEYSKEISETVKKQFEIFKKVSK
ncbi:variable surface lipoprotein [Metamycoplasma auris]|uniref:Lipoprotein n=1 Tax=Metamycoplasma auris TaxID=51363 RepID=A0A2W7FUQ5_9BACT|nr:variable surface lipoprotein [Metamycoplasma auris]PZV97736.1 hypothetical protein BCF89_1202 [Metamycoplasma auris]